MDLIKQYYKLCAVRPASESDRPMVDQIQEHVRKIVFSNKQSTLYIKEQKVGKTTQITVKENIIGGRCGPTRKNTEKVWVV